MLHRAREGEDMQTFHRLRQPLAIPPLAAEARRPGEVARDHSPAWQPLEAALGFGQTDHLEADAVRRRGRWRLSGVAPIASRTAAASGPTRARSCASTSVTCSGGRCPSLSTARWSWLPSRR